MRADWLSCFVKTTKYVLFITLSGNPDCVCLPAVHLFTVGMLFILSMISQGLGVVPAEEWDEFMAIMRQPLPSTFRITGTRHLATAVRQCLQHTFFTQLIDAMQMGIGEGEELTPPTPLPWWICNLVKGELLHGHFLGTWMQSTSK